MGQFTGGPENNGPHHLALVGQQRRGGQIFVPDPACRETAYNGEISTAVEKRIIVRQKLEACLGHNGRFHASVNGIRLLINPENSLHYGTKLCLADYKDCLPSNYCEMQCLCLATEFFSKQGPDSEVKKL